MFPDNPAAPRRPRGRIVMIVDNGVNGDSRVEKSAKSAAEAGWDVTLLGVFGGSGPQTWRIGDAEVRLLTVSRRLRQRRTYRRSVFRPFAYPPDGQLSAYRLRSVMAWRADLTARSARLTLARQRGGVGGVRFLAGKARIRASRYLASAVNLWARFRAGQLTRLQRRRESASAPMTRFSIWFWRRVLGDGCWRRLDPGLWEYELAFGPVIDKLTPDIIHAHDFRMIGVGARATLRARARGRQVKLLYDAHEFVPGVQGRPADPLWLPAQIAYEREHIGYADAVVTVAPALADLLREVHGLPERPEVVLNAPVITPPEEAASQPVPDIRALCGIDSQTTLMVYSGGINKGRGLDLVVDALPRLPGVHLAMVSLRPNVKNPPMEELQQRARELGVADRVHPLSYVPHWQVAQFIAPANLGVSPLRHTPNHELAMTNKMFEYGHAGLPVVTSDVRTSAAEVRKTGQGEVFKVDDLDSFVRAVQAVLAGPEPYRAAYRKPGLLDSWTWEAQAKVLDRVYARLLPGAAQHADAGASGSAPAEQQPVEVG